MGEKRLDSHPIVEYETETPVNFTFNGQAMMARKREVISSALFANGVHILGAHHLDGSHQGIFCANGQCAQCLLLADGLPVKSWSGFRSCPGTTSRFLPRTCWTWRPTY